MKALVAEYTLLKISKNLKLTKYFSNKLKKIKIYDTTYDNNDIVYAYLWINVKFYTRQYKLNGFILIYLRTI